MADIDRGELGRDPTTGATTLDWQADRDYWRDIYASRSYARADRPFEFYEPGYRFGTQEAKRLGGRTWDDVQNDLERGWSEFRYRGEARWEDVKDAVRDAWDRVTGKR